MPTTSAGAVALDLKANTKQFERDADAAAGRVKGIFGRASSAIGKLAAAGALAAFGKQCVEVASDLAEVQNVVDVTFPRMSAQADEWARSAADAFGLSETMAKRYLGTFGSMAEAFGFTESQAYEMSTALTGLAGDVASFYNISQDEAYTKLKSVFSGETEALKSLGVVMTQSALDQYALANGFGRTTAQMSEQEKVTLRLAFVQNALGNAQGDFARTSSSWANQTKLLQLRMEELKAAVGGSLIVALLPAIQMANRVVAALTSAAQAVYRFVQAVASTGLGRFTKAAGKAVGFLTGNSSEAAESTSDLAAAQGAAADAAGGQAAAVGKLNRTLAGFDRINKLVADSASGGGGGGGGVGGISDAFDALGDAGEAAGGLQEMLDSIKLPENLIRSFEHLRTALGHLADVIRGGLSWAWENVLKPLGEWTINEFAPALVDALASAFDAIASALDALYPIWDALYQDVLRPVLDGLGVLLVDSLKGWRLFFDWLKDVIEKYIDPAIEKAMEAYKLFKKDNGKVTSGKSRWWDPLQMGSTAPDKEKGFDINGTSAGGSGLVAPLLGVRVNNIDQLRELSGLWNGISDKQPRLTASVKERNGGRLRKLGERWEAISDKTAELTGEVKGQGDVDRLKKTFEGINAKTVTVTGKVAGQGSVDRIKSTVDGMKSKTIVLGAVDDASRSIDYAVGRLSGFQSKTISLNANDNASGKIDQLNRKSLNNHWADLYFTPKLTKTNLYMKGAGSNFSVYFAANGGYFERNTPRLAVIGDNTREGEIVSPESKFQTMLDRAAGTGGNAETVQLLSAILGAVQSIEPSVVLDGRAIARSVVSNINRQTQSTGRSPLII